MKHFSALSSVLYFMVYFPPYVLYGKHLHFLFPKVDSNNSLPPGRSSLVASKIRAEASAEERKTQKEQEGYCTTREGAGKT